MLARSSTTVKTQPLLGFSDSTEAERLVPWGGQRSYVAGTQGIRSDAGIERCSGPWLSLQGSLVFPLGSAGPVPCSVL